MTIELRTADGRLMGRINESWQAPPLPAESPKPTPKQKHGRKS